MILAPGRLTGPGVIRLRLAHPGAAPSEPRPGHPLGRERKVRTRSGIAAASPTAALPERL